MALLQSPLLRSATFHDASDALERLLGGGISGAIFPQLGTPLQPTPGPNKPANSFLSSRKWASDSSVNLKGW